LYYFVGAPDGVRAESLLDKTEVKNIATKYGKTPAQILLRHLVQQGIIVIPKVNYGVNED